MKRNLIALAAALALPGAGVAAGGEVPDSVTFAAGQRIPATLTMHATKGDPAGRLTPIYNNYRPKVSFGGDAIICMFYLDASVKKIAPGQTAPVSMDCKAGITVAPGGARFVVLEGSKEVGFGTVKVPMEAVAE